MSDLPTAHLGSRVPRKAKSVLDRLVGSRTITQSGMEWLIAATDPFHDDRVRMPGYPDMSTVNSVVQTYPPTVSISAPSGQTAPWDLHVPFLPVSPALVDPGAGNNPAPMTAQNMGPNGDILTHPVLTANLYAGWNAISCATSGQDWYVPGSGVTTNSAISIPTKYASGHYRLIGSAIEAVNTTADLYKGGAITAYRAPSSRVDTFVSTLTSVGSPTVKHPKEPLNVNVRVPFPITSVSLPPTTQVEASSYTDSRTWSAEDGAYVICTQSDMDNPYLAEYPGEVALMKAYDSTTAQADATAGTTRVIWTSWQSVANNFGISRSHAFPFDTVGFIMTGLNPNSTIQLTARYFFERAPSTTEPDLLSMAQVPPAFDGTALEIYSRCLSEMPVGVPQSENPLGEWFSGVLDTIKSVAPKLGNIVSGVGRAISEIGGSPPVQSNAVPIRNQTPAQKKAVKQAAKKSDSPPSYEQSQKAAKRKARRARQKAKNP